MPALKHCHLLILCCTLPACATMDKAMRPVDSVTHGTESTYQSASNSVSETFNDLGEGTSRVKSGIMESSLGKLFMSDESIAEHREASFVTWKNGSQHNLNKILHAGASESGIADPSALQTADKMKILKEYFFKLLKDEHARSFASQHKQPEFNEFLTDRENIKLIHDYKIAIAESEHQWRLNLSDTQKKVAELALSTLYGPPNIEYVSYDPYEEEIFFSVNSRDGSFKQKVKVEADKTVAQQMKSRIAAVETYVFFKFDNDVLEFVGINIKHQGTPYVCEVVEDTYSRQSDVVFTSEDISLASLDVQYYDVVKNVKPPEWFNTLPQQPGEIIGYGEGISKEDAKKEAFRDIAMSIRTTVSAKVESEKSVSGSTYARKFSSSSTQKVEDVEIEGSQVLKLEKKDGIWFVAIAHQRNAI